MGQSASKKNSKRFKIPQTSTQKSCKCWMYEKYNHCCFNECFPKIKNVELFINIPYIEGLDDWSYTDHHKKSVFHLLSLCDEPHIDTQFFISIIESFITNQNIPNRYHVYCHGKINNHNLCNYWFQKHNEIKLTVLGKPGVGKTSLITQFVGSKSMDYTYLKKININDDEMLLDISDTTFNSDFDAMRNHDPKYDANLFFLVFAINDKASLEEWCCDERNKIIKRKEMEYENNHWNNAGLILVGTKLDVMYECDEQEELVKMKEIYDRAMILSNEWNIPYIETSSLKNINVGLVFNQSMYEYWIQTETNCMDI